MLKYINKILYISLISFLISNLTFNLLDKYEPHLYSFNEDNHINNSLLTKNQNPFNKPNIILIIADDLGVYDLENNDITPNINSIAKNGVNFKTAYAQHSTCSPSRASLYTGRYPNFMGFETTPVPSIVECIFYLCQTIHPHTFNFTRFWNNPNVLYKTLDKKYTMISEKLQSANYDTFHLGKWHLGNKEGYRPLERGYNHSISFYYASTAYSFMFDKNIINSNIVDVYNTVINYLSPFKVSYDNKKRVSPKKYMTYFLADEAIKIINKYDNKNNKHTNRPFFINLAFNAPHNPYQSYYKDFYDKTIQTLKTHNERVYYAMIKSLDNSIGNILSALINTGNYENTIIIFTSDNGGTNAIEIDYINFPYRGWKCTFFEGGIRVPLYIQWKKHIKLQNYNYTTSVGLIDIFPTLWNNVLELEHNFTKEKMDGINLISVLNGIHNPHHIYDRQYVHNRPLFWKAEYYTAIRYIDFKLIKNEMLNKTLFYNLKTDPTEKYNIYGIEQYKKYYNIMDKLLLDFINKEIQPSWRSVVSVAIPVDNIQIFNKTEEFVYFPF